MWKLITFALGFVPGMIKAFLRRRKINAVNKINNAVDADNDKLINNELRNIVTKADNNSKANS